MSDKSVDKILEGEKPFIFNCAEDKTEKCLERIKSARIIYIGEMHFTATHQKAEIEIIKDASKKYNLQIALEEFSADKQEFIDESLTKGFADSFLKNSEQFPLLQLAYRSCWKVIAMDKPGDVSFTKPETIGSEREEYWAKVLIPHLGKEIKTFVIVGQAHVRKYFGFPIRLARLGYDNYVIIELK